MFNDMALLVEEQDTQVVQIEQKAVEAEQNMGQAEGQLQKAVKSARAARRKRWICFFIILIIRASSGVLHFLNCTVIIIAVVLAVTLTKK